MRVRKSLLIYLFFCVISLLLNVLVQHIVQMFFNLFKIGFLHNDFFGNIDLVLFIKMLIATGVSFIFKFLVDKYVVFFKSEGYDKKNYQMVILYTLFSVITTILFWGSELLFKILINNEYVGIVIGLTLGYSIKYNLDKNFVFNTKKEKKSICQSNENKYKEKDKIFEEIQQTIKQIKGTILDSDT